MPPPMSDQGSGEITIAFIGDVMLGRGVNGELPRREPESFWGDVLPVVRQADAVIANLECAITTHRQPWSKTPKVFHFGADPKAVDVLRTANVQAVSLANNHVLDFEEQGLLDTLDHLDAAGIARAGAGRNAEEAARPAVFDVGPLRVGMISLTDNEPPFAAAADRPGTNYIEIRPDRDTLARVQRCVDDAKAAGARLVVLALHWGPNMVERPPEHFQRFARAAIDSGVDILFGHSAHVFQAVEVYQHRLILYDTGDFLDDYAVDPDLRNDWSFVYLVDVRDGAVARLRMIPVRLKYAVVNRATGGEAGEIVSMFRRRCNGFDTPLREAEGEVRIDVAGPDDSRSHA